MGVFIGDIDVFMDTSCFDSLPFVKNLRIIPTTEYEACSVYVCVYKDFVEAQVRKKKKKKKKKTYHSKLPSNTTPLPSSLWCLKRDC